MALVDNGVKVSVHSTLIPSTAATQTVTEFSDVEYTRDITVTVLKATVQNVDKGVTFDNIIDNVTIGIKKQVTDIMGADYDDVAKTVTYYTEYKSIDSNINTNLTSNFYDNVAVSYECKLTVFIKTS